MYTQAHVHMHAHTGTHIHMQAHTPTPTHMHTHIGTHRHTCTHMHTRRPMHTPTPTHTHVHTCTHTHAGTHRHLAASSLANCVAGSSGTLLTSGSSLPCLPWHHVTPAGRSWISGPTRLHPVFNVVTPLLTPLLLRVWHRAAPGAFTAQVLLLVAGLSSHEPLTGPSK